MTLDDTIQPFKPTWMNQVDADRADAFPNRKVR